ncbi:MAG: LPS assembly protein LptD, partial [Gammaproteobacteria bacterium]|nr:LPS assembly protein LptD [Gammaproteobacteria bacterium]
LRGSSALIDNDNDLSRVQTARYVLHETGIHGSAAAIVYDSESGRVSLDNGEFSRCEPIDPFWTIAADAMTLDPAQGRGTARDLRLRLGDTTVFRYPFELSFPLGDQRVSGFLPPSMGSTRSGGFDFELPYYLNLAPHYDATVMPRLVSDRGVMLGAEFRYLAERSMNTVNLSWLGNDRLFDPQLSAIPGSGSPPTENRWYAGLRHNGLLGENWRTMVDFTAVSDRDWFIDLAGGGLNVTTRNHLNRQARLSYASEALQADLDVQRIQIIDPLIDALNIAKPYDRLPHFRFRTGIDLGANLRFGLAGQAAQFDRKLDESLISRRNIDNGALATGSRVNLSPRLDWALETPGSFLRAAASYDYLSYELDRQALGSPADPSLDMAGYSIDGGLIFERPRNTESGGENGVQTLEPRLYYLYRQYRDQSSLPLFDTSELNFGFPQLFRERRFSGGDRFADADQLGIAVTSRLLDDDGRERARFSLGQVHYFRDRLVSLADPLRQWQPLYSPVSDTSALAGEMDIRLRQNWRLSADVQWNEHHREVDEGSLQLRYQRDGERIFNLSWRHRSLLQATPYLLRAGIDPNINQTDVSGAWPLSANWKLLARWNYDHANSRNLEAFAGVEYRNCCATIRVIARQWLDEYELFVPNVPSNRGVFVQFSLHGLGNLAGGGLSELLSDGIQGFRDPDYE